MPAPRLLYRASLLLAGLSSVLLSSTVFADGPVYRTITREYHTDSYYTKGLMVSEVTAAGSGAKFVETENTYALRDVTTGKTGTSVDAGSTTATIFPMLARTDRRFYEGQGSPGKATYTTHEYDALGNVIHFADAGDPGAADDVEALINYSGADAACQANHIKQ